MNHTSLQRRAGGWLMSMALVLLAAPVSAQIFQDSRHTAQERRQMLDALWERLGREFDAQQAAELLEPGNGSLQGVMGFSERFGLRRRTVVADREWVELFPMTPYMQQLIEGFGLDKLENGRPQIHVEAAKFSGRVLTDRQGNFQFHGLKPGKYFLVSQVPYKYRTVTEVDTGSRSFSYSAMTGSGTISPIYDEIYGIASDTRWVAQIVEVKDGQATEFTPPRH